MGIELTLNTATSGCDALGLSFKDDRPDGDLHALSINGTLSLPCQHTPAETFLSKDVEREDRQV